jgi:cyanoexosortase A
MKLSFPSPPEQKLQPAPKILTYLDKRVLIALVYGLFVVTQALSFWRQGEDYTKILINLIFFGSAFYYYYQRRHQLKFPAQPGFQIIGAVLLGLVVFKLLTLRTSEVLGFWAVASPMVILGIILLAAGTYGIKQFWRFWLVFLFLSTKRPGLGEDSSWLTVLSAKVSSYFLWYLGFNPSTKDSLVYVNGGIIDIYNGCTLTPLLFISINLLVILYVFYPISRRRRDFFVACSLALVLSFVLSIIRLTIMALVVNDVYKFNYWHGPQGSNLFMIICLVGSGLYAISRMPAKNEATVAVNQPLPPLATSEWFLKFFLLIIALVMGLLMVIPDGGAKRLASFQFPENIPLSGWETAGSEALSVKEMGFFFELEAEQPITNLPQQVKQAQEQQTGSNIFMAGRHYGLREDDIATQMTLTYVLNSDATFPNLGDGNFNQLTYKKLVEKADIDMPYLIIEGNNKTHLVSCLTAGGRGIVTPRALKYSSRIRDTLSTPQGIYQWMTGQRLVQDHRCLWVHLSEKSFDNLGTKQRLVGIWQDLQRYWSRTFPPL